MRIAVIMHAPLSTVVSMGLFSLACRGKAKEHAVAAAAVPAVRGPRSVAYPTAPLSQAFVPNSQVKTLRLLQYFPPPEDRPVLRTLNELLRKIITGESL